MDTPRTSPSPGRDELGGGSASAPRQLGRARWGRPIPRIHNTSGERSHSQTLARATMRVRLTAPGFVSRGKLEVSPEERRHLRQRGHHKRRHHLSQHVIHRRAVIVRQARVRARALSLLLRLSLQPPFALLVEEDGDAAPRFPLTAPFLAESPIMHTSEGCPQRAQMREGVRSGLIGFELARALGRRGPGVGVEVATEAWTFRVTRPRGTPLASRNARVSRPGMRCIVPGPRPPSRG